MPQRLTFGCLCSTQRVVTVIGRMMKEGKAPEEALIRIPAMRYMRADLEATATKLGSLSNLNRTVHLPTYNKLIVDASLALKAGK